MVDSCNVSQGCVIDTRQGRLLKMRRSVVTTSRLVTSGLQRGGFRYRAAFLLLSYRDVDGWRPDHLSAFFHVLREWCRRQGVTVPYVWVAELQERGAVHYHVLLWLPRGLTLPKPDKRGWWPHGFTSIRWARRPVGYMAKYASKGGRSGSVADGGGCCAEFPRGLRLHGFGQVDRAVRRVRGWWMLPAYIRDVCSSSDGVRRCPGGGWIASASGEWIPPEWGVVAVSGCFVQLVRLRDRPPPLQV